MKVRAFDVRNRALFSVSHDEATLLIQHQVAKWRGKKKPWAITVAMTKHQLILFLGLVRFRQPEMRASDSKTYRQLSGIKGFEHRENAGAYANALARIGPIMTALDQEFPIGSYCEFDPSCGFAL